MNQKILRDGEPCSHRGCLSHLSHPCEGCGRIGGKGEVTVREFTSFTHGHGKTNYMNELLPKYGRATNDLPNMY